MNGAHTVRNKSETKPFYYSTLKVFKLLIDFQAFLTLLLCYMPLHPSYTPNMSFSLLHNLSFFHFVLFALKLLYSVIFLWFCFAKTINKWIVLSAQHQWYYMLLLAQRKERKKNVERNSVCNSIILFKFFCSLFMLSK